MYSVSITKIMLMLLNKHVIKSTVIWLTMQYCLNLWIKPGTDLWSQLGLGRFASDWIQIGMGVASRPGQICIRLEPDRIRVLVSNTRGSGSGSKMAAKILKQFMFYNSPPKKKMLVYFKVEHFVYVKDLF